MNVRARVALSACASAAMLTGCGGQVGNGFAPPTTGAANALARSRTFHYVGMVQTFKVPAGVTSLTVVARGAAGGAAKLGHGARGGRVYAVVPVRPGEKLYVYVGGEGAFKTGAFNGGGSGGDESRVSGYGGGGASDVREGGKGLRYRIVVSGGGGGAGGGQGFYPGGAGGKGGGTTGASGLDGDLPSYLGGGGGGGGTQRGGGQGGGRGNGTLGSGDPGDPGSLGRGGNGGGGEYGGGGGGGAGGGYYGGGGGGAGGVGTSDFGGGGGAGGGSSYVEPSATQYRLWQGWKKATGAGQVVLSW